MGFPIAGAIIAGSLIGGGATVLGGRSAGRAATRAAELQAQATREAIEKEWQMFQQAREDYAPWREAGERALTTLEQLTAAGPGEFKPEETPGYTFGFENLIRNPYLRAQSARGKRLSGETLKGFAEYATNYAETGYQAFLDRYHQKLNPYLKLAGMGEIAVGGQAQAALGTGTNIANLTMAGGQTQAQNFLTQGNIATGMSAGIAGVGQNALGNYMDYLMLQKLGVFPPKLMRGVGSGYA